MTKTSLAIISQSYKPDGLVVRSSNSRREKMALVVLLCVCVCMQLWLLKTKVIWNLFQNVHHPVNRLLYGIQLRRKSHNMSRYYENLILPFSFLRFCTLAGCFVCIAALIVFYSTLGSEIMMLFISNTTIVEWQIHNRIMMCSMQQKRTPW